jgi:hypothetical protein
MLQKALLLSGLLSSLVYAAVNVVVPMAWHEYSVADQTVSELSAIGAPTRALWICLVMSYILLFAAFGWGVLRSPAANRSLRSAGWLILAYSAFNLYWPPMHQREVLAAGGGTLTDTLHLVWAGVTVFLFVLIMGFGAIALGRLFRVYTTASVAVLILCGLGCGSESTSACSCCGSLSCRYTSCGWSETQDTRRMRSILGRQGCRLRRGEGHAVSESNQDRTCRRSVSCGLACDLVTSRCAEVGAGAL